MRELRLLRAMLRLGVLFVVLGLLKHLGLEILRVFCRSTLASWGASASAASARAISSAVGAHSSSSSSTAILRGGGRDEEEEDEDDEEEAEVLGPLAWGRG